MKKSIGGFFELENLKPKKVGYKKSVIEEWSDDLPYFLYSTARCAVISLVNYTKSPVLWLPEIFCDSFNNFEKAQYFPLMGNSFDPDFDFLINNVTPGHSVLFPDYFGTQPSRLFEKYIQEHKSIFWIQDASQNLLPKVKWGDFIIYSPRKLFGVTDGGVLIQNTNKLELNGIQEDMQNKSKFVGSFSPILRKISRPLISNSLSHNLYKKEELKIDLEIRPPSLLTNWQLKNMPIRDFIRKRKENFATLNQHLHEIRIEHLDFNIDDTPFGFPIYAKNRNEIKARLAQNNIFAAIHWASNNPLNSDRVKFHQNNELTIPCDHRYDQNDMNRIVQSIKLLI